MATNGRVEIKVDTGSLRRIAELIEYYNSEEPDYVVMEKLAGCAGDLVDILEQFEAKAEPKLTA
jgi:hypothetical protein